MIGKSLQVDDRDHKTGKSYVHTTRNLAKYDRDYAYVKQLYCAENTRFVYKIRNRMSVSDLVSVVKIIPGVTEVM